jgi:DNA (cytosine-5)-methyltransferase 1
MGWENVFHCEWNEFGKKILKYYWPNAESFDDIKKTNFEKYANKIDILTGGFPCQPFSSAGKRMGKEDERHLWPEMLRAIREIQPRWIVGENVFGITNWNGGLVFDEIHIDLENLGYEIQTFVIPACGVNAPHKRDRVWFVAHTNKRSTGSSGTGDCIETNGSNNNLFPDERGKTAEFNFGCNDVPQFDSNTTGKYCQSNEFEQPEIGAKEQREFRGNNCKENPTKFQRNNWDGFPIESPVCDGNDGIPTELDGITIPKWKTETIKAGGNAIVPQVAFEIFKAIHKFENGV